MSSEILLYEITLIICLAESFLGESFLEIMISRVEKGCFNVLPRSAGLFRRNRESIAAKMQKPGQNILLYTLIFFKIFKNFKTFTLSKSDE